MKPTKDIFSHKSNGAGFTYELALSVYENRLVWINGPFFASVHDITMFRNEGDPENSLKELIPDGKLAVGDKGGYTGESHGDNPKTTYPRDGEP